MGTYLIAYLIFMNIMSYVKHAQQDVLIDSKQGDLKDGHNEELDWTGFTQNCSKRNKDRAGAEVRIDHTEEKRKNDTVYC